MEVSLTGLKGPAGRGRVVGLRGCDLVLPWGTHPRMATAPAGLAPRLEGKFGPMNRYKPLSLVPLSSARTNWHFQEDFTEF